jgi:hypothetical protein
MQNAEKKIFLLDDCQHGCFNNVDSKFDSFFTRCPHEGELIISCSAPRIAPNPPMFACSSVGSHAGRLAESIVHP